MLWQERGSVLHQIDAARVEASQEYWQQQFERAHNGVLLIDRIDALSKDAQQLLFDGMATQNGMFGYGAPEQKSYNVRVVAVSSRSVEDLRDRQYILGDRFFDRIAQLVVAFPSFKARQAGIAADFKKV